MIAFYRVRRLTLGWLLFATFAVAFVLWRSPVLPVWDDAPNITNNLFAGREAPKYTFHDPQFWDSLYYENFAYLQPDGYRPLNWILRTLGTATLVHSQDMTGWLIVNGVLLGLLACSLFHLSRRFTESDLGSILAVVLVLMSTPLLTASLVLFGGIQTLVPLAMVTVLLCYFQAIEGRQRVFNLTVIGLLLFFGPWYREFIGLTAVLLIFLEWQRGRWLSTVTVLSALGFAHALFPTALVHLLLPDLPVAPVYRLGVLCEQIEKGVTPATTLWTQIRVVVKTLHWRIFLDPVSIFPPTLFLLAALGLAVRLVRRRQRTDWGQIAFLLFFFLLTFLPFLKVFKMHVHLLYCLIPLAILLAVFVEACWAHARLSTRMVLSCLLALIVVDHVWNAYIVRYATRRCQATMRAVASKLKELPPDSLVLCNAHHIADIQLFARGHFRFLYTVKSSGVPEEIVKSPEKLEEVLAEHGDTDIYCLDVRIPEPKDQIGNDRQHWIVRYRSLDMESLGHLDLSCKYRFIDPLRVLIPTRNIQWPFSPDLQFNYYIGPALDGSIGFHEIAVCYHLYKVTGKKVRRCYPRPILLFDDYEGFNLVGLHDRVYGIPRWEGPFDVKRVRAKGYSKVFEASTLEKAKEAIRTRVISYREPTLLYDNCYGFNLVGFKDRVYAIPRPEGKFDIDRIRSGDYTKTFEGGSFREVTTAIRLYISERDEGLE